MDTASLFAVFVAGIAVMLTSLVGALTTTNWVHRRIEKKIGLLSSFSAGVFLVVGAFLLREVLEHEAFRVAGFIGAITSALFIIALSRIPEFHHHHSTNEPHEKHSEGSVTRILFSDALHTVGDGMIIGIAFAADIYLGIVTTLGIIVHETLQELSEFFLLRERGLSTTRALTLNLTLSSTVFIGIVLSFFVTGSQMLESGVFGAAAGAILTVVFLDLVPHSVAISKKQNRIVRHLFMFACGAALMAILSFAIRH